MVILKLKNSVHWPNGYRDSAVSGDGEEMDTKCCIDKRHDGVGLIVLTDCIKLWAELRKHLFQFSIISFIYFNHVWYRPSTSKHS